MVHLGNVEHILAYHALDLEQQDAVNRVRNAALAYALVLLEVVPTCADQQVAIRKVRESMMVSNAAIALRGDG
jgi:hypothetical protein